MLISKISKIRKFRLPEDLQAMLLCITHRTRLFWIWNFIYRMYSAHDKDAAGTLIAALVILRCAPVPTTIHVVASGLCASRRLSSRDMWSSGRARASAWAVRCDVATQAQPTRSRNPITKFSRELTKALGPTLSCYIGGSSPLATFDARTVHSQSARNNTMFGESCCHCSGALCRLHAAYLGRSYGRPVVSYAKRN